MSWRALWRNEFPRHWWRSRRWWLEGACELPRRVLTRLAPVLVLPEVLRVVRHGRDPWWLSRRTVTVEDYLGGMLFSALSAMMSAHLLIIGAGVWFPMVLLVLTVSGLLVSGAASMVLLRSRWRSPRVWSQVDFVQAYAPRYGRPPETPDEYEASRLQAFHGYVEQINDQGRADR